mgnify:FL=1
MFSTLSGNFTVLLFIALFFIGTGLFWQMNKPKPQKKEKLIPISKRQFYEGPPEPCCVFSTTVDGKTCYTSRSLITGKDFIFPYFVRSFSIQDFFLSYGYVLAQETFDSKIKLVDWT